MKRKSAYLETGREVGGGEPTFISVEPVRVLGVNKKTGKVWVKSRFFCTMLVDPSELVE